MFIRYGVRVSDKTVAKLLKDHGYSLQAPNKSVEGKQHPDRNAQFEHINTKAEDCLKRGVPVLSVGHEEEGTRRQILEECRTRVVAGGRTELG